MSLLNYLIDQRVEFEMHLHPPAFSSQRLARVLGRPGREVTKTLLVAGPDGFFLCVLPSCGRLAVQHLESLFGGPVRLATRDEIATRFRDCEWGLASPFGNRYGLPVLLDSSLARDWLIVLEGQTRVEAVELRCADLERLTGAFRMPLTEG